jgi:Dyp-type peroxidase family
MIPRQPVREAPFPSPYEIGPSPCRPDASGEDLLNIDNIQGNILAGFNKDFQTLLFLKITDVQEFKQWLKDLTPFVATTAEVLTFNRLFKEIRTRRHSESRTVQATWMNLALSFNAIKRLAPADAERFKDQAFRDGLSAHSASLGDPTAANHEGNPTRWLVGGKDPAKGIDNEADVVLIFAADDRDDLMAEVARIEDSIFAGRTPDGKPMRCGVQILFKQHGAVLPPPLKGHEHFGFLDGVSQPGLRGRLSENPHDVLTLRQNPNNINQGKPGQDLLWPGEFVFGYRGQDAGKDVEEPGPNSLVPGGPGSEPVAPEWAKDGAYLVFRRLRQDVPKFRAFVNTTAASLGIDPGLMGAKLVGRWKSGAPVMRARLADVPQLAGNDCANNDFEFGPEENGGSEERRGNADCLCQPLEEAPPDPAGTTCPFAAHIRKTYPRNDKGTLSAQINERSTQTHRLLRRGIPFGPAFPVEPPPDHSDSGDRGLLFLAYQTSIEQQFEFVQKTWVNNPDFKDTAENSALKSGHDLIIGQNGAAPDRKRTFVLNVAGPGGTVEAKTVETTEEWVIPTGGGYFFAPSISALERLAE